MARKKKDRAGVVVTSERIYEPLKNCRIVLTKNVFEAIRKIVDLCPLEVAWCGTVRQKGRDLFIEEIYLPKQIVTAATYSVTPEGMAVLISKVLDSANGREKFSRLAYWGHSHVYFPAVPSGTDERNVQQYKQRSLMIRSIANKRGEMRFDLFFFQKNKFFLDVPWVVSDIGSNWDFEDVAIQLQENVFDHSGKSVIS
jgi:hypothetical protein